ncbi:MAG: histidinol dehydrogenase, partial [Chloroflexia bacterium]
MIEIQKLADLSAEDRERILSRAHGSFDEIMPTISQIFDEVRDRGDDALREYTKRFDGVSLESLITPDAEFDEARKNAPPELVRAIKHAAANVAAFHNTHLGEEGPVNIQAGVTA